MKNKNNRGSTLSIWQKKSARELARDTAEFDDPEYRPKAIVPPPDVKVRHDRAIRKLRALQESRGPGRPKTGKGFRRLSVSIEGGLLDRVEAWRKRRNLTRAQAIAQGLKMVMAEE